MKEGIRLIVADPAGNTTGFVLTPTDLPDRPELAARLMEKLRLDQVGFIDEGSLSEGLPRMEMMGGEFCGNATRAFALLVAIRRGLDEGRLMVSVSGSAEPVPVDVNTRTGEAYAAMPLPTDCEMCGGFPVVQMEGISHAILQDCHASEETARQMLEAMPEDDAQGVIFLSGDMLTPFVHVAAAGTDVWEGSCGSGSVAAAWLLSQNLPDGEHRFEFTEPGGALRVDLDKKDGRVVSVRMGGPVRLGEETRIIPNFL